MRRFDYGFLKEKAWDNEIVGYLSQIHEQKGKQTLYLRQKPAEVEKLIEIAKIQSTESSNEIEGIRTTDTRLRQLMSEKTTPRTRDEKEIAGYRDALNTVHENFEYIPLTPNYILQLHKIMYSHTDSALAVHSKTSRTISARPRRMEGPMLCLPLWRRMKRRRLCGSCVMHTTSLSVKAMWTRC